MKSKQSTLESLLKIYDHARSHQDPDRCMVSLHPDVRERLRDELEKLGDSISPLLRKRLRFRYPKALGLNDGLIYPPSSFPAGTHPSAMRSAARDRAPLAGTVRIAVVLADFDDAQFPAAASPEFFTDRFFSNVANSVRTYFKEVSNNSVDVVGDVVGPYRMPKTLAEYANDASGLGGTPSAKDMAADAAAAADGDLDYSAYDNDGDGYVDAFVVVHAGQGAERTASLDDIWSHKSTLREQFESDGVNVFAYMTVPENAAVGLCAHELGHLLFGLPDLYDLDDTSAGVGSWCLMGSGNWLNGGATPGHPCAWAKADLGWVSVHNVTENGVVEITDVKTSQTVYRLSKNGSSGSEYFLVENRQRSGYDEYLPGEGLLVWHVDEAISSNSDESHPKIYLEQADATNQLDTAANRGDAGDPWPGTAMATSFGGSTNPSSAWYSGAESCVAVENIPASGVVMPTMLKVRCGPAIGKLFKDFKDFKDGSFEKRPKELKELKEPKELKEKELKEKELKEPKELKEKELKEKELKERKELKEPKESLEPKWFGEKGVLGDKHPEKPVTDKMQGYDKQTFEKPGEHFGELQLPLAEPFIGADLRPDLVSSALNSEDDLELLRKKLVKKGVGAKRAFDSKPKER